jgi:hypothetical protein
MNPDYKKTKAKEIVEEPTTTPRETNPAHPESAKEFCKRLGIRRVNEKGGREFGWNGPPFHDSQAYGTKRKREYC